MLDFAVKLTGEPWLVGTIERRPRFVAPAGFTDRDIWDIAAVAGFFNMSNRLAAATDMRPNAEYFGMARTKKAVDPVDSLPAIIEGHAPHPVPLPMGERGRPNNGCRPDSLSSRIRLRMRPR